MPLRFVAEALGAQVSFDAATRGITSRNETQLDVPPLVQSGRSLVPVRFVAEAMGAMVEWDPDSQTVTIQR